jgi:cyclase
MTVAEISPRVNPFAPRSYGKLHQVTPNVYIYRNITNSSFVIGDEAVAVVDTQVNEPTAERLLRLIRSVTTKPLRYVINTHYHWDHTNGNQFFKNAGATILSSKMTKEFMIHRQDRQKEFLAGRGFRLGNDPLLPEKTFEGECHLDLGNMPLRLFFAGRAETDDATAVHVLKDNVLMSGDTVMTGSFPIFGQPVWDEGLQDTEWPRTLRKLMSLKPRHVIPGHGPLAHEKEVELLLKIQEYFLHEVKVLVEKGLNLDEILLDLEPRLPSWITSISLVWGTPRYAILRAYRGLIKSEKDEPGWQQYKPSAIPRAKGAENFNQVETWQEFLKMAEEAQEGGDEGLRLDILKKATEVFHDSPEAHTAYAEGLIEVSRKERSVLEKGDFFQQAKLSWDRALELNPLEPGALLGKGRFLTMMAYRGGDDPADGMKLLRTVIEMKPNNTLCAEAEFYLGMGYRRLGDEVKANQSFETALKTDPAFAPARVAIGGFNV